MEQVIDVRYLEGERRMEREMLEEPTNLLQDRTRQEVGGLVVGEGEVKREGEGEEQGEEEELIQFCRDLLEDDDDDDEVDSGNSSTSLGGESSSPPSSLPLTFYGCQPKRFFPHSSPSPSPFSSSSFSSSGSWSNPLQQRKDVMVPTREVRGGEDERKERRTIEGEPWAPQLRFAHPREEERCRARPPLLPFSLLLHQSPKSQALSSPPLLYQDLISFSSSSSRRVDGDKREVVMPVVEVEVYVHPNLLVLVWQLS